MPYKRNKDETNLIKQWTLRAEGKFYYHVYLWADRASFEANTLDNQPGHSFGCCNLAPSIIEIDGKGNEKEITRPKLGEIHFIKDLWTLEIVAHELCHALLNRIRALKPTAQEIMNQDGDSEETICYEFGKWAEDLCRVLWTENPRIEAKTTYEVSL